MFSYIPPHKIVIITGHYGSGKTNISVNLALSLASMGKKVTIVDMDTVNPYFRTADSKQLLTDAGVKCIIPEYANSNVDIPSLPAEIYSVFDDGDSYAIFDVGGDDAGATALSMFNPYFQRCGYEMLYTVSKYRPLIAEPTDAVELLRDIEGHSRLSVSGIINNSNIGCESTARTFTDSFEYADAVARLAGLPVAFDSTCLSDFPASDFGNRNIYIINDNTKKLYGGM